MKNKCNLKESKEWSVVEGSTGERLLVNKNLNKEALTREVKILKEKGINSVAVVLMHSYMYVFIY
jgi:5-oxoprolinase (ATP-hydrolysing)